MPPGELENAGETYTTQHEIAAAVIERVRHLEEEAPAGAAPAEAPSSDTPWRVIAGSGSRDGHYAIAWGFKDKRAIGGDTAEFPN